MVVLFSFWCECWFVVQWQSERECECVVEKERKEGQISNEIPFLVWGK